MKKNIFFLISLLTIVSCTDITEEVYDKIPSDVYPENALQISTLTVPGYSNLTDLIDDEGWWFLAQEITSDEMCAPTRGSDWDDGGKWRAMHQHIWTNDVEAVNNMWSKLYDGVITCNIIYDEMGLMVQNDDIRAKLAEIQILRSFYYYLLIDNFGDVPYLTSASSAPEKPFRNKRSDIFDSITVVIEQNIGLLQDLDKKYLATRSMAQALLAKLYLNAEIYTGTAQWSKAGAYCDSIMNKSYYALSTNPQDPFLTKNENNSEIIFSIGFDEDKVTGFRLHMRTLHYLSNLTFNMPVGPWNGFATVYDHFNTYEDGDIRKESFFLYGTQFASDGSRIFDNVAGLPLNLKPEIPALNMDATFTPDQIRNTGARIVKYEVAEGAQENLSNDFVLFRLTDIILMKAETEIRMNGAGAGDDLINQIRKRAEVADFANADLVDLLAERGRELFSEGHRRQDLIRFGVFGKAWWEKAESDETREIFPIPQWATDANSNLLLDPQ